MNAHATLAVPGATPMQALAASIMDIGLAALPRADHEYFELADWQSAASYALDSGDTSELSWMLLRDRAYNRFCEWQAVDFRHREDADFPGWLADQARWDKFYEGALTQAEVGGTARRAAA